MSVTVCPVALAIGCRKCPIFKVCPAKSLIGDSHWQRLAVFAIIDDLNTHQRDLTLAALGNDLGLTGVEAIDGWKAGRQATLSRTESLFTDLRQTTKLELAMLAVANRALRSLLS